MAEEKSRSEYMFKKRDTRRSTVDVDQVSKVMLHRRKSYGFASGINVKLDRSSMFQVEGKRPMMMYLPTYQLESSNPFNCEAVERVVKPILETAITGHKYEDSLSASLALRLASDMMTEVKSLNFNRYRIIAIVTIGQKRAQSYNNAVAMMWDPIRDNYVDLHSENTTCFVQATIFGIYLD